MMVQSSTLNTEFTANNKPLLDAVNQSKAAVADFSATTVKAGDMLKAVFTGAVILEGVAKLTEYLKGGYEAMDNLVAASSKLDIGVNQLNELRFAAKMTNTDIGTLEDGLAKLRKRIGEAQQGNTDALRSFTQLGLSADVLAKKNLKDAYLDLSDAIKGIGSSTNQSTGAIDVLGRAAQENLKLLRSDLRSYINTAKELSSPFSEADIKKFEEVDAKFKQIAYTAENRMKKAFIAVAGVISEAIDQTGKLVEAIKKIPEKGISLEGKGTPGKGFTQEENPTGLGFMAGMSNTIKKSRLNPNNAPIGEIPQDTILNSVVPSIKDAFKGLNGEVKYTILQFSDLNKAAKSTVDVFEQNRFKDLFGLNAPDGKSSLQSILSKPTQYVSPEFTTLANEVRDLLDQGVGPNSALIQTRIRSANAIAQQGVPVFASSETGLADDTKFATDTMKSAAKAMLDLANSVKTAPVATIFIKTDTAVKAYVQGADGRLYFKGMIEDVTGKEAAATAGAF